MTYQILYGILRFTLWVEDAIGCVSDYLLDRLRLRLGVVLHVCGECGGLRDERTDAGMKCARCAYGR